MTPRFSREYYSNKQDAENASAVWLSAQKQVYWFILCFLVD